jgi:hypothetical protein
MTKHYSMEVKIFSLPDDLTLFDPRNWSVNNANIRTMVRDTFVIVASRDNQRLKGPLLFSRSLPIGAEIKFEKKESLVKKNSFGIDKSIQTVLSSKIAAEIGASSKISSDFLSTLTDKLTTVESYEVSAELQISSAISYTLPQRISEISTWNFYLPVWKWNWDIYLVRTEKIQFYFHSSFIRIFNERTIKNNESTDVKIPIARIVFYEPQDDFPSLHQGDHYKADVSDASMIRVEPLTANCPNVTLADYSKLEDFVEIAFPLSKSGETRLLMIRRNIPKKRNSADKLADKYLENSEEGGDQVRPNKKAGLKKVSRAKAARYYKAARAKNAGLRKARAKKSAAPKKKAAKAMARRR